MSLRWRRPLRPRSARDSRRPTDASSSGAPEPALPPAAASASTTAADTFLLDLRVRCLRRIGSEGGARSREQSEKTESSEIHEAILSVDDDAEIGSCNGSPTDAALPSGLPGALESRLGKCCGGGSSGRVSGRVAYLRPMCLQKKAVCRARALKGRQHTSVVGH